MYIIPSAKKAIKDMHCQLKMPDNVNLDAEFVAPDLEEKPCPNLYYLMTFVTLSHKV